MPDILRGLSVVVTRPASQAAGFQHLLGQAGATAVLFPVIAIVPPENQAVAKAVLAGLDAYDTAIFISANAVRFGLELLDETLQQCLRRLVIGAVGKQTAEALQQCGYPVQWVPGGAFTSEAFLALPETQQLAGRRILIFRGEGGRELLAESLQRRGASVDYVEVYRRVRPKIDANCLKQRHKQQQLDIIAITSSEGLLNLLAMLDNPDWIKTVPLLVGSQRIGETARQTGFTGSIVIADNPSDKAMMQALSHWVQECQ